MNSPVLRAAPEDRDRLARIALHELFEPGDRRIDALLAGMSPYELFVALREGGREDDLTGARADIAPRLDRLRPDRTLELGERVGLRYLTPEDPDWPRRLDDLRGRPTIQERTGAPLGLWVKGPLSIGLLDRSVAMVGSRDGTHYGAEVAGGLAAGVAREVPVVSGGAYGIDAAAHRGALAADGATVAVLACGADQVYPRSNERLLTEIARTGAVLSELPPGEHVTRMRFLGRNRLIAALTSGTVLVEAALRSGALNTANWATALNRVLMCVPGPITSTRSMGVLEQLRHGRGMVVTRPEDILELVGQSGEYLTEPRRAPETQRDRLRPRHRQVLDAVPLGEPATAEAVARRAGVALASVGIALVHLERYGFIERCAEGWRLEPEAAT